MKLVIAEKPSVAQSLAAVIGATTRKDGYLEGGGWRVSWCVGHLAGLADADAYNPEYAKWRYDDLPILPEHWQMVVSKDKKKQFDVLKQLMNAPDVTEVVNACDAGREGELIFRAVYELAGCQKPMKRLWISSMEDSAIREGFANLRPGADYDGLRDAALCRAKADWLVGINATRLFSVLYHRTLNIGRVMSPTLALIVQREAEIDTFKPVPFYTVTLELPGFSVSGERMADKGATQQLKTACQDAAATVKKVERKDKSEKPPALYDLTTLQRDANRLLGFTAQQTLDYLQKSLVNFFMFEAGFSLMFVKANSGTDDKYYIAGHVFRIVSCLNQVLFACNNAYCINEKKAIKLLETFEHKPEKYTEKVNHIFEVLGISLFECYDMTEKLYNEVNEIVSEINNFLNEESSDERKQI
mgnify:CR=1